MANSDEKLIDRLNYLIAICNDGMYGYKTAAQNISSTSLKKLFSSFSKARSEFANALKYEVQKAGGNPDKGGAPEGMLHRAWINIKSILPSKDKGILDACITGEKAAINAYEEILRDALLPTEVRSHINMQYVSIKEALRRLEEFR
jgi:uncharacterized protein (TIGR02284 family)